MSLRKKRHSKDFKADHFSKNPFIAKNFTFWCGKLYICEGFLT